MIEDEVRDLLRELIDATGATGAAVVHEQPGSCPGLRALPLGNGAFLRIDLPRRGPAPAALPGMRALPLHLRRPRAEPHEPRGGQRDPHNDRDVAEAMERTARALRACARRWNAARVPACATGRGPTTPPRDRVRERILSFLRALAGTQHAVNAVVTLRRDVVLASHPLTDEQQASIPFIIRRVDVEASRGHRSHAELAGDDFYALSFWFHACLVVFFSGPYAVDFLRHRARLVTRELSQLLALLDDPPPASTNVAPLPD